MFWRNVLPKTVFFYIFSSGAPCFVSCSFVFSLLSFFCLSGAPFLILLRPFCLSGAPFLIYTFFSGHALSPKVGGPYVFAQFSAKNIDSFTFFHRGPLVLFLVLLFLLFSGLFVSRGPFSYICGFFSGHALSPKVGGPYVLAQFSATNPVFFTCFPRGPLVLLLVKIVGFFKLFCVSGPLLKHILSPPAARFWGLKQLLKQTAPP